MCGRGGGAPARGETAARSGGAGGGAARCVAAGDRSGHIPSRRARRFGTSYATSCEVGIAWLAGAADYGGSGPRLYDPFLVQDDGSLYPVPVKVANRAGGDQVGGGGRGAAARERRQLSCARRTR